MVSVERQGSTYWRSIFKKHVYLFSVKRPIGIDPTKGVGTAYEGYVRVPKVGGIRKGWGRMFVVVCDFKLFLYDIHPERGNQANVVVNQVVDMR